MPLKIDLIPATLADYPVIQNLGRFYIYELSRHCGIPYNAFKCPEDGLIEFYDSLVYFSEEKRKAFLVKVDGELAGFLFVDLFDSIPNTDYFLSEFFILAKFQGHGVGKEVAKRIFDLYKGTWALGVIPENTSALKFWQKVIPEYTQGKFMQKLKTSEELKTVEHPEPYPLIIFTFVSAYGN
jgi:predicted acetyltransferase